MKTYAIGDLHGRYDLLQKALAAIFSRTQDGRLPHRVVFLGDYSDRGPQSRQVVERLMLGPRHAAEWVILKGNHEDMIVEHCRTGHYLLNWMNNGGGPTLLSYGHPREGKIDVSYVPERHVDWMDSLPTVFSDGVHVFVHAGLKEGVPFSIQPDSVTLWMLYPEGAQDVYPDYHVVHGHEQFAEGPMLYKGRTNLDTHAYYTGRLVIGVFDEDKPEPVGLIEVKA